MKTHRYLRSVPIFIGTRSAKKLYRKLPSSEDSLLDSSTVASAPQDLTALPVLNL